MNPRTQNLVRRSFSSRNFAGLGDTSYVQSLLQQAASKYGVPYSVLDAIAYHESRYKPEVTSSAGAMGVMQLMPGTAKQYGVSNAYDPVQNVDGGAHLISDLIRKYNGDLTLALAAYSAGSGNVAKYNGVPPFAETQEYVSSICSVTGLCGNPLGSSPSDPVDSGSSFSDYPTGDSGDSFLPDFSGESTGLGNVGALALIGGIALLTLAIAS